MSGDGFRGKFTEAGWRRLQLVRTNFSRLRKCGGILGDLQLPVAVLYHRMSETYQLYQYASCPFCYRVRRFLDSAGIDIETRDTLRDPEAFRELVQGGGSSTVPCLRIDTDSGTRWLYESLDIIEYLKDRFLKR